MLADNRIWDGKWIWGADELHSYANEMVLFRKRFQVTEHVKSIRLYMTADSRYQLFLNGHRVGLGPCKGERFTKYYETYEIADGLRQGSNTLAVKVLHYAPGGPQKEAGSGAIWRSPWGGLLLDGELLDDNGSVVDTFVTDDSWSCYHDPSYALKNESWMSGNWLGGVERVDGRVHPGGWEQPDYDDSDWKKTRIVDDTWNKWGGLNEWPLAPRPIPPLYETDRSFVRSVRSEGWPESSSGWPRVEDSVIAPNSKVWIELDAGELTTGYLTLRMSGGAGSRIKLLSSECYEGADGREGRRSKGVRDDSSEGQVLLGDSDHYFVAGYGEASGMKEVYEPFWFRTFRFVRLEIETGAAPLTLHSLDYRETGYPLEAEIEFQASDSRLEALVPISVRTLQRCMHESYEDCPFYEQLQYTMDTALQMQFNYRISSDDRLARKAIHDFHSSRLPDGMLQCRYPSAGAQVIPGFALYWVMMLHDHYSYYGDSSLLRMYLPTADGVLEWFRRRIDASGLVGASPREYWSYVDWVASWDNGIPGAAAHGPLTVINLLYATALRKTAELQQALGRSSMAEEYVQLADEINAAVRKQCWSQEEGLFRDGPGVEQYSQHPQIWSVLSGLVNGQEAADLMTRMMKREDLATVSYSMAFYLFRALEEAEVYDQSFQLWEQWHAMVDLHLTTWVEDPNGARSDCHAWGAVPLYEFPSVILGVRPAAPGFAVIGIEPHPGPLEHASGTCMTPHGQVRVSWRIEDGTFTIEADGPAHLPVSLRLPDGTVAEFDSCADVHASCGMPQGGVMESSGKA